MRAKWAAALSSVRDSVLSEHAHEELRVSYLFILYLFYC